MNFHSQVNEYVYLGSIFTRDSKVEIDVIKED